MDGPRSAALRLLALVSVLPCCTAVVAPDDDVLRCGSADDCPRLEDNRYVSECVFPEESELDGAEFDKVCVAAYRRPSCAPRNLGELYEGFAADRSRFTSCGEAEAPLRGCPARGGRCASGLVVRADGICDLVTEPDVPAFSIDAAGLDPAQDLLDVVCQSFFCDERFVCDEDYTCVLCDPSLPYGRGGCGRIFTAGEPSCLYPEDVEAGCDGPEADISAPFLGAC